jgi:integrase
MKYVSVFRRSGRAHWYVSYFDPLTGKRKCNVRTPYAVSDPQGYRKAVELANELSRAAMVAKSPGTSEDWAAWVEGFLRTRYRASPGTLSRARVAWGQWRAFLADRRIAVPRALSYNHVMDFIAWRSSQVKRVSKKVVSHNTALYDVRFMSIIMREAVRRGFATSNPCAQLGVKKDPARQKPEMTDEEVARIRSELQTRPEWMRTSFEIAIHQGCRLRETRVHRSDVDLERRVITFHAKGHNVFATQLHDSLVPLLRSRFAKHEWSLEFPPMPSKKWHDFFKRVGLSHLCFHCTRVTVVTRMARAGVPIQQAMAYVGHANELIHSIYRRLKPADLSSAVAAIRL